LEGSFYNQNMKGRFAAFLVLLLSIAPPVRSASQLAVVASGDEAGYEIVERGVNHAVYRRIAQDEAGAGVTNMSSQFILLENGLHYLDRGEYKESEDLIESFSDGAIARRGPNKAVFSHDMNVEAVFDIEA
jgi:hypothetical protein